MFQLVKSTCGIGNSAQVKASEVFMESMLAELEWLTEIVKHGSFTKASTALGVPKSTLSRAVTKLESSFKVPLLVRTTRRVQTTAAGAELVEAIGPHLSAVTEAARRTQDRSQNPEGLLRVAVAPDAGTVFLSHIVPRFAQKYPSIQVEVELAERVVDLAADGFDIAVRAPGTLDLGLVTRKVADVSAGLYTSVKRAKQLLHVRDLTGHPFVFFRAKTMDGFLDLDGPKGAERIPVRGQLSSNSFTFVMSALENGAGFGLLPTFLGELEAERGRLVRILPDYQKKLGSLYVVYPQAKFVPRKTVAFRDFVISEFANQCSKVMAPKVRTKSKA